MKVLTDILDIAPRTDGPPLSLVLDADRTLAPVDTGRLVGAHLGLNDQIRSVFETNGYTVRGFRLHSAIWSSIDPAEYLEVIARVAATVELFEVWARVLSMYRDARIYVVTAGIPQVWQHVLQAAELDHVQVLGGLHARLDPFLVTPACKAAVVRRLQIQGDWVMAAGDSEIDLAMLACADLPVWIADSKGSPRLQQRLHEVPGALRLRTDERIVGDWPTVDAAQLEALLDAQRKF